MFKIFANYSDGSHDDMDVTDFAKVKKDVLKSFFVSKDGKPYYELFFEPGQRAIYRIRTLKKLGHADLRIIMIGWQKDGQQSISYIFPDYMIQRGKFQEGIFSEPQWHKYEDKNSTCDCSGCVS